MARSGRADRSGSRPSKHRAWSGGFQIINIFHPKTEGSLRWSWVWVTGKSKPGFKIGEQSTYKDIWLNNIRFVTDKWTSCRWRRANNTTGTSNGQPNQSNGDNASSGASSDDDDDMTQRPLQMYLHHQQYYKQMKELQKQQKDRTPSDNDDNDVDVN